MDWFGGGGGEGDCNYIFFHFLIWVMGSISVGKKVMWNNHVSNLVLESCLWTVATLPYKLSR